MFPSKQVIIRKGYNKSIDSQDLDHSEDYNPEFRFSNGNSKQVKRLLSKKKLNIEVLSWSNQTKLNIMGPLTIKVQRKKKLHAN